jgi:hypothetical protein
VNGVAADVPYSERLWVPRWIHAAVFIPSWLFLAVIGWFATAAQGRFLTSTVSRASPPRA